MNTSNNYELIAEVKIHSPFGWQSDKSWDELFEVANQYGDWLSIHTDPRWHGSLDLLRKAVSSTNKPILAKGIHATDSEVREALECGAEAVLVVGRIPAQDLLPYCLIEASDFTQFSNFCTLLPSKQRLVWNSRDLKGGKLKPQTFDAARGVWPNWLCQASNIRLPTDIHPTANAVLVGQNLLEFVKD